MNQSTHPASFSAFLLGALFNVFVGLDMASIADYTIKALIGGIIWTVIKISADYLTEWLKKDTPETEAIPETTVAETQTDLLITDKTQETIIDSGVSDAEKKTHSGQESKKGRKRKTKTSTEKSNRTPKKKTALISRFKRKGGAIH